MYSYLDPCKKFYSFSIHIAETYNKSTLQPRLISVENCGFQNVRKSVSLIVTCNMGSLICSVFFKKIFNNFIVST